VLQIAALSDIHGNFGALLAVWRDLERHDLSTGPVLNAGDNVCYGENPEETVQFLRSRNNIFSAVPRARKLLQEKVGPVSA